MDHTTFGEPQLPVEKPPSPPSPPESRQPEMVDNGPFENRDGFCCGKGADLIGRRFLQPVVVGEIRQNLDDLKAAVLSYYSRLYSHTGRSIDERLDRLAAPPFSNSVKTGRLPLALNERNRLRKQGGIRAPPPFTCFDFIAEGQRGSKDVKDANFDGRKGDPEAQKSFYGIAQLPGRRADQGMKGCDNFLGQRIEETRGGHINELLGDLRTKCAAATKRLNTIGDQLERECEDPNLREWEFTTFPEVRRHPNLGRDPHLRRHLLTLYKDLVHQSQANQLKINAIQGKLKILNLHTKSDMIKLKSDPRIAF